MNGYINLFITLNGVTNELTEWKYVTNNNTVIINLRVKYCQGWTKLFPPFSRHQANDSTASCSSSSTWAFSLLKHLFYLHRYTFLVGERIKLLMRSVLLTGINFKLSHCFLVPSFFLFLCLLLTEIPFESMAVFFSRLVFTGTLPFTVYRRSRSQD